MRPNVKQQRPQKMRKNRRVKPQKKTERRPFAEVVSFRQQLGPMVRRIDSAMCALGSRAWRWVASLRLRGHAVRWRQRTVRWCQKVGGPVLWTALYRIFAMMRVWFSKERMRTLWRLLRTGARWVWRTLPHLRHRKGWIPSINALSSNWLRPKSVLRFFDPRVVRLEEPNRHMVHTLMITLLFTGVALTAFAVAASAKRVPAAIMDGIDSDSGAEEDWSDVVDTQQRNDWLGEDKAIASASSDVQTAESSKKKRDIKKTSAALPADFYNPYYVFTQAEAKQVRAYPLANPPGIVVNIRGIEEPEESAAQMVGEDKRIQTVKRLNTAEGLRYILRLTHPVKRIESHTEGNVITISPLQ